MDALHHLRQLDAIGRARGRDVGAADDVVDLLVRIVDISSQPSADWVSGRNVPSSTWKRSA
jgi:hypothetical protein